MRICRTGEWVSVGRDSAVLVIFVTPDVEGTANNISEWRKIM